MSRSTRAALARPTSASTSPVMKWTTLSVSRLSYGSPQRSTGMRITLVLPEGQCQKTPAVVVATMSWNRLPLNALSFLEPRLLLVPLNTFLDEALESLFDLLLQLLPEGRAVFERLRENGLRLGLNCLVQR